MTLIRTLAAYASALLGLASLTLLVLGQGGRVDARLDVLNHFAPAFLGASLLALLMAILARGGAIRTGSILMSVAGLILALLMIGPEVAARIVQSRTSAPAGDRLVVVQFNGWGRNERTSDVVRWILDTKADVVVLEEAGAVVTQLVSKEGYSASCLSCGVTVCTRQKPVRTIPADRYAADSPYFTAATISDTRGEFTVVGLHRYWPTRFAKARAQTAEIDVHLARLPKARLIVAGDFNSTPWSFARRREDREWGLVRRTRALFTWPAATVSHNRLPAPFPYLPIDHIYAGPGWATVSVTRGPRLGSDHYPVVVTLAPTESGG